MNKNKPAWFVRADNMMMRIYKAVSYIALICLVAIMLIAVIDVIGEKLAKVGVPVSGISYYSDWIAYLHVPVVFFSAGFVTLERGHTCVDILTNKFHAKIRTVTEYFSMILGIVVSAFMTYRGFFVLLPDIISHHTTIGTSSFAFPQWPFTLAYCLGLTMLMLSFVWALLRLIFHYRPAIQAEPGAEPEIKEDELP